MRSPEDTSSGRRPWVCATGGETPNGKYIIDYAGTAEGIKRRGYRMVRITLAAFETSDEKESGTAEFDLRRGVRVRKYEVKKECCERGIEISAEVATIGDCDREIKKLFKLAGIPARSKKRPQK